MWDTSGRELKGIRFDELLLTHDVNHDIIKVGNGYYCLDFMRSSYIYIKNLKIAFSIKHDMGEFPRFGIGFNE